MIVRAVNFALGKSPCDPMLFIETLMKASPPENGFTLVELLIVVTIIGVLIGISIPTLSGVLQQAKKVEARSFMSGMQQAVASYRTEYGDWPPFMRATGDTDTKLENSGDWTNFYGTMTAKADFSGLDTQNRRRIRFLDVPVKYLRQAGDLTTVPSNPLSATIFVDPWDKFYWMWVDANYDGVLRGLPNLTTGSTSGFDIPGEIAVWSAATESPSPSTNEVKRSVASWR